MNLNHLERSAFTDCDSRKSFIRTPKGICGSISVQCSACGVWFKKWQPKKNEVAKCPACHKETNFNN